MFYPLARSEATDRRLTGVGRKLQHDILAARGTKMFFSVFTMLFRCHHLQDAE